MRAAVLALGLTLSAPYQCGTEPNERPVEDSPPKALWMLAERFKTEGQASARALGIVPEIPREQGAK